MNKKAKYYLGLDIGTDSVGWAVTDEHYKLLRANNKSLWGVRLFDKAEPAVNRRLSRESRRRLERRKWRLGLLQELFAPIINNVDDNFYARLSDSNLYDGDKREKTKFSLFNDRDFTDKEFYKKYKTIYHLRLAMMQEADPDPRLVYLALHHIIKYRGHFLQDGESVSVVDDIAAPIKAINAYLDENEETEFLNTTKIEEFRKCLFEKLSKSERAERYRMCFDVPKNSNADYILRLIAGNTVKISKLCPQIDSDESITFDCDWDTKESELQTLFQDDYQLIENAKLIYDYSLLKRVLGDNKYISQGMIEKYEKHKQDLFNLKYVLKKYFSQEQYDEMFKNCGKMTNYTAYSGKYKFGKNINGINYFQTDAPARSYEKFIEYVKSVLVNDSVPQNAQDDPVYQQIVADIENQSFMPKQVSKNNSTLPYQLNLLELETILDNVSKYPRYSFLGDTDNQGVSVREKIRSLLTFRIPYYVGPINNHSNKYWVVRNSKGKVLPWNFSYQIDLFATENKFIKRMTNDCPVIPSAKVLPKNSILYEEFIFLNAINSIKINGERLPVESKNKLSEFYACTGENKLTKKIVKKWLIMSNVIEDGEDVLIEGMDDAVSVNRRTYYQFFKIFNNSKDEVEKHRDDIEKIILYSTIAGQEKNNLIKRLVKEFPYLSNEQLNYIKALTLKGWGKRSKEFLTMRLGTNPDTGEIQTLSIMDVMRSTSLNYMEAWHKEIFGFQKNVESLYGESVETISYDLVNELYCSPAVKKQIWQTLCIIKELTNVMGQQPEKVFVEVAREANPQKDKLEEKKRTRSRYDMLSSALESIKNQRDALFNQNVYDEFKNINQSALQNSKLFLYFMQNGKDIYTGENIDYNHLELYDKDHIYPRSKIKDDSIHTNLVLTYRVQNATKTDTYPIDESVRRQMISLWSSLKQQKLMSAEKFKRLTRNTPLTDEEMAEFINRQLVETRQSTKEVIKLLHRVFPESEIIWSKAGNVSDFRSMPKYIGDISVPRFVKCREINDLHHAKDAYLNIVVGNVFNTQYGHDAKYWLKNHSAERLVSSANLFDHDVKTQKNVAWIAGNDGTMAQVEKTMRSNAILFTCESQVKKGQLFDATIQKKSNNASLVSLKGAGSAVRKYRCMSNVSKYGGYIKETCAYYMLVKYVERKEMKKGVKETVRYRLLGVASKDICRLTNNESRIEYCLQNGLQNAAILIDKIKIGTMFEFNKTMLSLSGKTGDRLIWRLAQQHVEDEETERYIKKIINVVEKNNKLQKQEYNVTAFDGVSVKLNKLLYDTIVERLSSEKYCGASSLKSLAQKLDSAKLRQEFDNLSLTKQCVVLAEMSKSLQCNALTSDLTELKEGKSCGLIRTSSIFDNLDNIKIVHRSVTGVFEQKIPLSKFDAGYCS